MYPFPIGHTNAHLYSYYRHVVVKTILFNKVLKVHFYDIIKVLASSKLLNPKTSIREKLIHHRYTVNKSKAREIKFLV